MENTLVIQTVVTIDIRMALDTKPDFPMVVDIILSECIIATTVEGHFLGNL